VFAVAVVFVRAIALQQVFAFEPAIAFVWAIELLKVVVFALVVASGRVIVLPLDLCCSHLLPQHQKLPKPRCTFSPNYLLDLARM